MKNNNKKLVVMIILIVFIGLFTITSINYFENTKIIKNDILNITELISTNIYSEIQLELIKPIYVSLTMANDTFVKGWIQEDTESNHEVIIDYLEKIRDKYDYDSSFLISDITKNYYHHDGLFKTISKSDEHDTWYFDALKKDELYILDVDTDEASENDLTLFINCVIHDEDENTLGITGVGVKMRRIGEILNKYNKKLEVETYLIRSDGLIQIHTDEKYILNKNIFNNTMYAPYIDDMLIKSDSPNIVEIEETNTFLISYYIEELDWFLIVEKDSDLLYDLLQRHFIRQLVVFTIAFLILSILSIRIINHYQKINLDLASTDSMTEVMNRKAFDEHMNEMIQQLREHQRPMTVMIVDIDNFKRINDTYGHMVGDECICAVADLMSKYIRKEDMLSRWGGDEFAAAFKCDIDDATQIINRILKAQKENSVIKKYGITMSFGLTDYRKEDTLDTLIGRADKALYTAKQKGKNCVEIE